MRYSHSCSLPDDALPFLALELSVSSAGLRFSAFTLRSCKLPMSCFVMWSWPCLVPNGSREIFLTFVGWKGWDNFRAGFRASLHTQHFMCMTKTLPDWYNSHCHYKNTLAALGLFWLSCKRSSDASLVLRMTKSSDGPHLLEFYSGYTSARFLQQNSERRIMLSHWKFREESKNNNNNAQQYTTGHYSI